MEKQQQERRVVRKDVDKVIDRFEEQRGRWSSPQTRECAPLFFGHIVPCACVTKVMHS